MKSITIKGSERNIRNAGGSLRVIRRISQYIFSTRKSIQKLGLHSNAHTVVIDLGDGKSFTAILKDIQVHPVTDDILY
jgi:large subunit ribosomal protein L25